MAASQSGQLDTLEYLIHQGMNVNVVDRRGYNALLLAVVFGEQEAVRYLIQTGANVNVENNQGVSAMEAALQKERKDIVKLLKKAGAKGPRWSVFDIFR